MADETNSGTSLAPGQFLIRSGERHWKASLPPKSDIVLLEDSAFRYSWTVGPDGSSTLLLDGRVYRIENPADQVGEGVIELTVNGWRCQLRVDDHRSAMLRSIGNAAGAREAVVSVRAPMPGLVVRIEVKEGQKVLKGQGLVILEAMKMENELRADRTGVVERIRVTERVPVEKGQELLVLRTTE